MFIPNEKELAKIIHLYNGLNFKSKFNLSTEEYKYLRKKYGIARVKPRHERLCWKCDKNHPSAVVKNTNLCTGCYYQSAWKYKKIYKIPDHSSSIINKICLKVHYYANLA